MKRFYGRELEMQRLREMQHVYMEMKEFTKKPYLCNPN